MLTSQTLLELIDQCDKSIRLGKIMADDSKQAPTKPKPLFDLGQFGATPGALSTMAQLDISPLDLIYKHITGDWSDMSAEDQEQNLHAIRSGMRVFSSYKIGATTKIWIITEADRSSTTLLLPSEY